MADHSLPQFSRAHCRSARAMGLSPEELAARQQTNRERRRNGKAAKLLERARAAGISVAEMRQRIKDNKAKAAAARRLAELRCELMQQAEECLFELKWRGAIVPPELLEATLSKATTRKCDLEARKEAIAKASAIIEKLAFANARRLRDVAMGKAEPLQ